jgi:hypothetical protein
MASEVNSRSFYARRFFLPLDHYNRNLLTRAFVSAPLFSFLGCSLRCTKQLNKVKAGRPFAWASRLQAAWPAPSKIMRSPRRPCKTTRSRSEERSQFRVSSTRGQPRARSSSFRSFLRELAGPHRGPIKATRSGTMAQGCVAGSASPILLHPGRARPWRASVRRCGSPARSAWLS